MGRDPKSWREDVAARIDRALAGETLHARGQVPSPGNIVMFICGCGSEWVGLDGLRLMQQVLREGSADCPGCHQTITVDLWE